MKGWENFSMLSYLLGQALEVEPGKITIAIGNPEVGLIGYPVQVPQRPEYLSLLAGKRVELRIHSHMREDGFSFFGFLTSFEREVFQSLLRVNGVGPKLALGILSKLAPGLLIASLVKGDRDALVSTPGIGKKTAERLLVELAEPLRKKMASGELLSPLEETPSDLHEAKEALKGLGFVGNEVGQMVQELATRGGQRMGAAELVRAALKQLAAGG